jgi:hypothetical protein
MKCIATYKTKKPTPDKQIAYRCFYLIILRDKTTYLSTALSTGMTVHSPGDNDWTNKWTTETLADNLAPCHNNFHIEHPYKSYSRGFSLP